MVSIKPYNELTLHPFNLNFSIEIKNKSRYFLNITLVFKVQHYSNDYL